MTCKHDTQLCEECLLDAESAAYRRGYEDCAARIKAGEPVEILEPVKEAVK